MANEDRKEEFERRWRRAERTVWRVAQGCGRCREDKEDVLALVRLNAWRAYGRFDPLRATFEAWVAKIAARVCLESLRRARRLSAVEVAAEEEGILEAVASEAPSALDEVLAEESLSELRRSMHGMPPLLRQTLGLMVEGLTPQEIAERTGTGVGAVRARLTRARDWLRRLAA